MNVDVLNQFPSAPIPTLSGFSMAIPVTGSQQPMMSAGPPVSMSLNIGSAVMGISMATPVGGAATQASGSFIHAYSANQVSAV